MRGRPARDRLRRSPRRRETCMRKTGSAAMLQVIEEK
jgi:hypothetical protein